MSSFLTIFICVAACGLFGFGLEAIFGNHDPGAVFPWSLVALLMGAAGSVIGFLLGIVIVIARLLF